MLLENKKAKREKMENLRDEPATSFNFSRKGHRDALFT